MTQVQKIVAWVLAFGLVISIGIIAFRQPSTDLIASKTPDIVPAQVGGYFEQTTVNAGKGVRFNDVATIDYVSWSIPAGTSTAAVQNTSGFDKFVDAASIVLVNPNALRQMVDASSSMYYILATSSTATIADYAEPSITSSLIASSSVGTSTGKYLTFSQNSVSPQGVSQGGNTTSSSNYASSTVLWRNNEYIILVARSWISLCGGAAGTPASVGGSVNYAKQCESATSSTTMFTPKATIQVRTP